MNNTAVVEFHSAGIPAFRFELDSWGYNPFIISQQGKPISQLSFGDLVWISPNGQPMSAIVAKVW